MVTISKLKCDDEEHLIVYLKIVNNILLKANACLDYIDSSEKFEERSIQGTTDRHKPLIL